MHINVDECGYCKGLSNILYGFLNPKTVRIWVGGWFIASMPLGFKRNKKIVHFFFNCFCSTNVPNDFSGGNNVFRAFIYKCNTFACGCREWSEVGITNVLTLI